MIRKLLGSIPLIKTPSGTTSFTASAVVLVLGLLNGWSWWAHQTTTVQTAAGVVLAGILSYLAGVWNVMRQPGQKVQVEATPGVMPTLQISAEQPEPAATAGVSMGS